MGNINVTSCSKLLLFGEHSAVYGYPALGIPLAHYLNLDYEKLDNNVWQIMDLEPAQKEALFALLNFYESKWPILKKQRGCITLRSNVPIGLGFGSSASLCVAFSRWINQLLELKLNDESLWQLSHEAEKIFHTTPSGIDTGLIVKQCPCCFWMRPSALPTCQVIDQCSDWYLVVGALPRAMATKNIIQEFKNTLKVKRSLEKYLKELGEISNLAIMQGLTNFELMVELVNKAHKILNFLGLSNDLLNSVLDLGKSLGAPAGKLSGAGKGGAFYFLLETKAQACEFYAKIQEKIEDKVIQKLEIISLKFTTRSIL